MTRPAFINHHLTVSINWASFCCVPRDYSLEPIPAKNDNKTFRISVNFRCFSIKRLPFIYIIKLSHNAWKSLPNSNDSASGSGHEKSYFNKMPKFDGNYKRFNSNDGQNRARTRLGTWSQNQLIYPRPAYETERWIKKRLKDFDSP